MAPEGASDCGLFEYWPHLSWTLCIPVCSVLQCTHLCVWPWTVVKPFNSILKRKDFTPVVSYVHHMAFINSYHSPSGGLLQHFWPCQVGCWREFNNHWKSTWCQQDQGSLLGSAQAWECNGKNVKTSNLRLQKEAVVSAVYLSIRQFPSRSSSPIFTSIVNNVK